MAELQSNEGKQELIEVDGVQWRRLPIKTHVVTDADDIVDVAKQYAGPHMEPGDVLFISEKCVACSQKRALRLDEIKPRKLAVFLSKHVTKTPHGIGLGIPETMEMALRECGTLRILFAAFCSVIGKLFGQKGWFYMVAGRKAASIDGPTPNTLPPYNECVVLGPADPDATAAKIAGALGEKVMIIDLNDLGGNILGTSDPAMDRDWAVRVLQDNPLGQCSEQTPMGILRKA